MHQEPLPIFSARSASPEAAFDWLPELIGLVRRRLSLIVKIMVVFIALALIYCFTATPKYESSVTLIYDPLRSDIFRQQQSASISDPQLENSAVESQIEILQSYGTALRVVEALRLDKRAEFTNPPTNPITGGLRTLVNGIASLVSKAEPVVSDTARQRAVEALQRMIKVKRQGQSFLIKLSVLSTDGRLSADLANGFAEAYTASQLETKLNITQKGSIWLKDRLQELKTQAVEADRAVQVFKSKHNIVDTDKGLMNERQVGDLNTALSEARSRIAESKARYDQIRQMLASNIADAAVTDTLQNPVIVKLRQQYLDDASKEAEWSRKYGKDSAGAVSLRNDMAQITAALKGELNRIAETYKSDYQVAQAREQTLQRQLDSLVTAGADTNQNRTILRSLISSADTYKSIYENFLQRYTQAVQDQSFPIPEARVITAAVPPLGKSSPKTLLILAGAFIGGLVTALGAALGLDLLDQRVRTQEQTEVATGARLLGFVPTMRIGLDYAGHAPMLPNPIGAAFRPASLPNPLDLAQSTGARLKYQLNETLNNIEIALDMRRRRGEQVRVIGCISVSPGEGKTMLAVNLAQHLTLGGGSVLLMDGDLRRRSLSKLLAPDAEVGLAQLLEGNEKAVRPCRDLPGVEIVPARAEREEMVRPAELLGRGKMRMVLNALLNRYNTIVIDLPPIAPVKDVQAIAHLVDGFVLVLEWGKHESATISQVLATLDLHPGQILGTVVNKVDIKRQRMLDKMYSSYYSDTLM